MYCVYDTRYTRRFLRAHTCLSRASLPLSLSLFLSLLSFFLSSHSPNLPFFFSPFISLSLSLSFSLYSSVSLLLVEFAPTTMHFAGISTRYRCTAPSRPRIASPVPILLSLLPAQYRSVPVPAPIVAPISPANPGRVSQSRRSNRIVRARSVRVLTSSL